MTGSTPTGTLQTPSRLASILTEMWGRDWHRALEIHTYILLGGPEPEINGTDVAPLLALEGFFRARPDLLDNEKRERLGGFWFKLRRS